MGELKPCPFCGGEVRISLCGADGWNYWTVTRGHDKNACTCRLFMESDIFRGEESSDICKEELIAKWNRRADDNDDNKTCYVTHSRPLDRDWNLQLFDLSCGHQVLDFIKPRYCVECGARVVV